MSDYNSTQELEQLLLEVSQREAETIKRRDLREEKLEEKLALVKAKLEQIRSNPTTSECQRLAREALELL